MLEQFIGNSDRVTFIGPMEILSKMEPVGPIVYIDGGLKHQSKFGKGFSLGDGDSSTLEPTWKLSPFKDESDFAVGLKNLPKQTKSVKALGFSGGRKDHDFINLLEALQFCQSRPQSNVEFVDSNLVALGAGTWTLNHQGFFSLVAFYPCFISIQGAIDYKLNNQQLKPLSSHGLSNRAFGEFSVETNSAILYFPMSEPKAS